MSIFEYFGLLCIPALLAYAVAIAIHIATKEKVVKEKNERIN